MLINPSQQQQPGEGLQQQLLCALTANRLLLPRWAAPSCSRTAKQQASLSTATHPPAPHTWQGPLRQHGPRQTGTWWAHTAWPCRPEKICYLEFKVITLVRSDCSNTEPPTTGHPKDLLEDARAVTEPLTPVADGQRSPRELCWLATSPGWHSSVHDLTPPDLLAFPQRSLGAAEQNSPASAQTSTFHISARAGTLTQSLAAPSWGTSPPRRARAHCAGTACTVPTAASAGVQGGMKSSHRVTQ